MGHEHVVVDSCTYMYTHVYIVLRTLWFVTTDLVLLPIW